MRKFRLLSVLIPLVAAATAMQAASSGKDVVIVTASNATANQLLVYNPAGTLLQTVLTGGTGGVSGNAGGIEANGNVIAVVNFGSLNVSMFERGSSGVWMTQLVPTISSPVSVAFGANHLYILGTTEVESHAMVGSSVDPTPDGEVSLVVGDGSAAQVGVLENQVIITEKSNMIETVNLFPGGAVGGIATPVKNIPADVNAPFGLVTRGNIAYVTIAHANQISLVQDGAIQTITSSGTQSAPCWVTLVGPYLFSSNSPSLSVSTYNVTGERIVQVTAVTATFAGDPTDIGSGEGLVAVIDASTLSIFTVGQDGSLTLQASSTEGDDALNGVAIVR
jgi:hypothetical protein